MPSTSYTNSSSQPSSSRIRNPLADLKTILLRHSERINNDATQNSSAIVAALHSLLKCAEMRYKCCFVEDCAHASYSRATIAASSSGSTVMTNNTTSMNDGGDNQCCASSSVQTNGGDEDQQKQQLPPAQQDEESKRNMNVAMSGSFSSDVDGTDDDLDGAGENGFGEWTASSDDSFMTADEGYDVCALIYKLLGWNIMFIDVRSSLV